MESYEAVSRTGERVEVVFHRDVPEVTIHVGGAVIRPAWGSQACDDWLDWMDAQRHGGSVPLPVDEPDWLQDEGYHR
ncbi:MAG: hypothetical protein ACXVRV_11140 [Gaiellaceae bacterium]